MQFTLVDRVANQALVRDALDGCRQIALDCEAAGFHRYRDTICLVQLSTVSANFIIDPLELDPTDLLKEPLQDPDVEVLMHGADFDMRLLSRDLGLTVRGLFDTQVAAALTGEPQIGLSALLEKHVGVTLSKKFQRADWATRPLSDGMLAYAASDTAHLFHLKETLQLAVRDSGRSAWVQEEVELLQAVRWEEEPEVDPVTRVKGARKLEPAALEALRAALAWRDQIAQRMDRAPFRVAGDAALLNVAKDRPGSQDGLRAIPGMPRGVVERHGEALLERLAMVAERPESELLPYPRIVGNGMGRPSPEEEERLERLKVARNIRAGDLGLDRGRVFSNAALLDVARAMPSSLEELMALGSARRWQVEEVGPALLESLRPPQPLP